MKGVAGRTLRHHLVSLVSANDFGDARAFAEHRQIAKKMQRFFALGGRVSGAPQFLQDGVTGEQFLVLTMFVPPLPRPVMAGKAFNIFSRFVVETRDRCLNINKCAHRSIFHRCQFLPKVHNLCGMGGR